MEKQRKHADEAFDVALRIAHAEQSLATDLFSVDFERTSDDELREFLEEVSDRLEIVDGVARYREYGSSRLQRNTC